LLSADERSAFQDVGVIDKPSGLKKLIFDDESETMRKGEGLENERIWLTNSLPTRPTPTTATQIEFWVAEDFEVIV